jgi:hypothetical protein
MALPFIFPWTSHRVFPWDRCHRLTTTKACAACKGPSMERPSMETTFPRTHYIPRDMLRAKTGMIGFTDSHKNRRPNVRFHFYVVNTTKMKLRTPVVCEVAGLWPPSLDTLSLAGWQRSHFHSIVLPTRHDPLSFANRRHSFE